MFVVPVSFGTVVAIGLAVFVVMGVFSVFSRMWTSIERAAKDYDAEKRKQSFLAAREKGRQTGP